MKTLELNIFTYSIGFYDCIDIKMAADFHPQPFNVKILFFIYCQVVQTHFEGHQKHVRSRCDGYRIPFLKLL